jgi:ferredoxin
VSPPEQRESLAQHDTPALPESAPIAGKKRKTMKVVVERAKCVASGVCTFEAPGVFDQDDEGIVVLLTEEIGDDQLAGTQDAVRACPAAVISLLAGT